MTLFGTRVFADLCTLKCGHESQPSSNSHRHEHTGRASVKTETQREDGHVKMETETGVMLPQTQEHLGHQNLEEAREGLLYSCGGSIALETP